MSVPDSSRISDDDHAALAALADGHLADGPADVLRARMDAEPALAEAFVAQQRARRIVRDASLTVHAPLSLREQIETTPRPVRRRRPQWLLLSGAAAGAVAVTAAAIVIAFGNDAPSVGDTLVAASQTATIGVSVNPAKPQLLTIKQDAVVFPNFAKKFGWQAVGARTDRIDGRDTTTVTYRLKQETAAYTVVGGDALDNPDGRVTKVDGQAFVVLREDGRTVVTWRRAGQTCVLSSRTAQATALIELASWKGKGAVRF